ncbi:uncharacterized protein LY89DRAFT_705652 [Mollisia scopiformis]|uniref:Uncharacterized protein n=1 Tax=Mollisia scopiformis TaxID=149040 RepID=A0A194XHV5_MOLSC|nr:uncharacterized protein LY89DRAFT_705652 [Mollisia scopiformis]KUJ19716.1 hypothetical protein LY89DRAFT_705652 [Mollisia scopiformis]
MTSALGVHLVGSVCGATSAEASFRKCCQAFPSRLRRIPDGEPANRQYFIRWQVDVFDHTPAVKRKYDASYNTVPQPEVTASEVKEIVNGMPPLKPGYADAALDSYLVFKKLREECIIPKGVRFQVSLPTTMATMCLIREGFQLAVEPCYEKELLEEMKRIQEEIPNEDLAIQIDIANEIPTLEESYWPHFKPYFEPVWDGILERIVTQSEAVHMGNKHFLEPQDLGLLAKLSSAILKNVKRAVEWIHMPVPKDRGDLEYFKPLEDVDFGSTELYLGLVHANDEEGSRKRMASASKVVEKYGIATECGMGRTPLEKFDSISRICTSLSSTVI